MILPDAMDGTFAEALSLGHGPETPVCAPSRLGLKSRLHNLHNAYLAVTWFAPTSGRDLPHGTNSLLGDALAPKRYSAALHLQVPGDFEIRFSTAGLQSNPSPEHNLLRS